LYFLLVLVALNAACAEDDPPHLQRSHQPVLVSELPRMGGDYPESLISGLSKQLVDEVNCIQPGVLARFDVAKTPGKLFTDRNIPHLLRPEVVAAAEAVALIKNDYMTITSGYRDVGMQYYDWLWGQRLGFMAARPGESNHQGGQAIDLAFYSYWKDALIEYGWAWPYGTDDAPHFEWLEMSQPDLKVESVRAFQRLWNRNHPDDLLETDGIWGPGTEARMAESHAEGFRYGGCDDDRDGHASPLIGGDDCDDSRPDVYPGALELCEDGIDQDCDGRDLGCDEDYTPPKPVDQADDWADPEPEAEAELIQDLEDDSEYTDANEDGHQPSDSSDELDPATSNDTGLGAAWSTKPEQAPSEVESACGCQLASSKPPILWFFLLPLLLALWRRPSSSTPSA
jgi:hypothetical protein